MLCLDFWLTPQESNEMASIPAKNWFTQVKFANGISPRHPEAAVLDINHEMKKKLMLPWIQQNVPGKRVLDLFSANGAFAIECALAGAKEIVGMEFDSERVRCANFLARVLQRNGITSLKFCVGDVYNLTQRFAEPFDIVLCMGGLYHIADPPYVLSQMRKLMKDKLIIQTSSVIPGRGNKASFIIREDRTSNGLSSIQGGKGVWTFSVSCFQSMLHHAGLRVLAEKRPEVWNRGRFPWYCAVVEQTTPQANQ
jgi:2-polyprenyl-3-methyl-5-hydroxy-6-metoxy-1,4-benzoquinol methylase